jgi:hypothetical protein
MCFFYCTECSSIQRKKVVASFLFNYFYILFFLLFNYYYAYLAAKFIEGCVVN